MASSKSPEKKKCPESDALNNEFKGKRIEITWLDGKAAQGMLEWVDTYTYGVRVTLPQGPGAGGSRTVLHIVNKAAIRHICPAE